jgi:hypothetical protein
MDTASIQWLGALVGTRARLNELSEKTNVKDLRLPITFPPRRETPWPQRVVSFCIQGEKGIA